MGFTQKVAVLDASQNLSTSPWTVSGLKGDQFDYAFMAFCDSSAGTSTTHLDITFNSDSGANYNNNQMRGTGTSTQQSDSTSQNSIQVSQFQRNDSSRNSLAIGVIRGDSSQNRTLTMLHGTGQTRVVQTFDEWTNNVDELTSLTFTGGVSASYKWHIVVWEVPKANDDNWELVNKLNWSASATEQSITGLAGDTDLFYKLLWDGDGSVLDIELNNQTTGYTQQRVRNSGTAFVAGNTSPSAINQRGVGSVLINAETGDDRTAFSFGGDDGGSKQDIRAFWYSDTATELTSLYCTPTASTTAEAKLFRAKYPQSSIPDLFDLPFQKVDSFSVNTEDFTTGQSFSSLDGDNVLLYRIEFKGFKDNFNINVRTNGDSGASDFAWQRLNGTGTTEAASSDTADTSLRFIRGGDTAEQAYGVMYIYPQSGEYRPCLSYQMCDENEIELTSGWRLDTVTEITSILLFSSATTTLNGTFTLSEIRL